MPRYVGKEKLSHPSAGNRRPLIRNNISNNRPITTPATTTGPVPLSWWDLVRRRIANLENTIATHHADGLLQGESMVSDLGFEDVSAVVWQLRGMDKSLKAFGMHRDGLKRLVRGARALDSELRGATSSAGSSPAPRPPVPRPSAPHPTGATSGASIAQGNRVVGDAGRPTAPHPNGAISSARNTRNRVAGNTGGRATHQRPIYTTSITLGAQWNLGTGMAGRPSVQHPSGAITGAVNAQGNRVMGNAGHPPAQRPEGAISGARNAGNTGALPAQRPRGAMSGAGNMQGNLAMGSAGRPPAPRPEGTTASNGNARGSNVPAATLATVTVLEATIPRCGSCAPPTPSDAHQPRAQPDERAPNNVPAIITQNSYPQVRVPAVGNRVPVVAAAPSPESRGQAIARRDGRRV